MIERKFVAEKLKEFRIQEFINKSLRGSGQSHTKLQRTPLGEKIVIYASKPGLVVGRGGENIRKLTKSLKKDFKLENPQIEISEVDNIFLDANIVAEMISNSLERFGSSKFKGVGHKMLESVMGAGALGIEILMSGKIPSARAKRWRFYQGYLKKCGDAALKIKKAYKTANLKTGVIGIQVRIMTPDIELDDRIEFKEESTEKDASQEAKKEEKVEEKKEEPAKEKKSKKRARPKKSEEVKKAPEQPSAVPETKVVEAIAPGSNNEANLDTEDFGVDEEVKEE